jgi:hypothetical protein
MRRSPWARYLAVWIRPGCVRYCLLRLPLCLPAERESKLQQPDVTARCLLGNSRLVYVDISCSFWALAASPEALRGTVLSEHIGSVETAAVSCIRTEFICVNMCAAPINAYIASTLRSSGWGVLMFLVRRTRAIWTTPTCVASPMRHPDC